MLAKFKTENDVQYDQINNSYLISSSKNTTFEAQPMNTRQIGTAGYISSPQMLHVSIGFNLNIIMDLIPTFLQAALGQRQSLDDLGLCLVLKM